MAEESVRTETPPEAPSRRSGEEPPASRGRGAGILAWVFVGLLAVFVCVQVAGVLLRDSLEGRRPLLAKPPAMEPVSGPKGAPEQPAGPEPSRFGPEVQEVVVARGDAPVPAAPTPATEASVKAQPKGPSSPAAIKEEKAPSPKAEPKTSAAAPAPKEEKPAPSKQTPAAPNQRAKASPEKPPQKEAREAPSTAAGSAKPSHVLLIDVFLSQKYLREAEQRLKKLGISSMRTEILRKGAGFKVQIPVANDAERAKASEAIESDGYLSRSGPQGIESYFYYRAEAQALADTLAKRGVTASVLPVDGERPYWKLLAGPFPEEEARKAQKRLSEAGVAATLEALP